MYWYSGCGRIELNITKSEAAGASGQGDQTDNVQALSEVPRIARQLKKIDPEMLRRELKEYGAWESEDLQDHDENLQRILWLACCGVRKEANQ